MAAARPARAGVDLTGTWDFSWSIEPGASRPMTVVQSGASISMEVTGGPHVSGTIDSVSGAFLVTSSLFCGQLRLQGFAAADGNTMSGGGTIDLPVMVRPGVTVCVRDNVVSFTANRSHCGNDTLDPGESCDDGNRSPGDCCSPFCASAPGGSPCADDGDGCTADVCDATGTCTHPVVAEGTICRTTLFGCDVDEVCDGISPSCPPDQVAPAGTVCRAAVDFCDAAELCDGTAPTCPFDLHPDSDLDGFTDACDLCPTSPVRLPEAKLWLSKYDGKPGNDKLVVKGEFVTGSLPDPVAQGVEIAVGVPGQAGALDVVIPPGAYDPVSRQGWTASKSGREFTFRSADSVLLITKARVRLSRDEPPRADVKASGRRRSFATVPPFVPLHLALSFGPPDSTTELCAQTAFERFVLPRPNCTLKSRGTVLDCRSAP